MEILAWKAVNRKRSNKLQHTDPSYVKGYDLDMTDFTWLVNQFNSRTLSHQEETRLHLYVMTMLNIVLENPKLNPSKDEMDGITDAMYMDGWGSLRYIKDGRKPYSYVYRSMYTAGCRFYRRKIKERAKEDAIQSWIDDTYNEWLDSVRSHRTGFEEEFD